MCDHHICGDPNGLRCVLHDHPDHPNGHSYVATGAPDGHDASERAAEDARG